MEQNLLASFNNLQLNESDKNESFLIHSLEKLQINTDDTVEMTIKDPEEFDMFLTYYNQLNKNLTLDITIGHITYKDITYIKISLITNVISFKYKKRYVNSEIY
jgi:hypothetical protein